VLLDFVTDDRVTRSTALRSSGVAVAAPSVARPAVGGVVALVALVVAEAGAVGGLKGGGALVSRSDVPVSEANGKQRDAKRLAS